MPFRPYDHLERLGHLETEELLFGDVFVFPKLDGTNASVWLDDGVLCAGSRNRVLSLEHDNADFYAHVLKNRESYDRVLAEQPTWHIYSEWLVPHTLKSYRDDAWRRSWVFDVWDRATGKYVPYSRYSEVLGDAFDLVLPLCQISNPSAEQVAEWMQKNTFLLQDNVGPGEGVVAKNYSWANRFGRQPWGKLVRSEFKDENRKVFGFPAIDGQKQVELEIVEEFVTEALVTKTRAKIELECPDRRSLIPRLLQTVYYELVREELWTALKRHHNPTIDFKQLQRASERRTKTLCKDLF